MVTSEDQGAGSSWKKPMISNIPDSRAMQHLYHFTLNIPIQHPASCHAVYARAHPASPALTFFCFSNLPNPFLSQGLCTWDSVHLECLPPPSPIFMIGLCAIGSQSNVVSLCTPSGASLSQPVTLCDITLFRCLYSTRHSLKSSCFC